ncbi:hypothetical protein O0L34_g4682 [Tuta absoluta]|nr:hypothetical protein O0L34_g4682 [Tuta absoluta]
MEKLREEIQEHRETLKEEIKSYASVAAGPPKEKTKTPTAMHSVIITSKDETESGDQVLERIRRAVNAKEGGVTIDKVRKAKDRKIILGCQTQGEMEKVKKKIEAAGNELNIQEAKNKDPLVILRGVYNYNTEEQVLGALRAQNKRLFEGISPENDRIDVKYKKKTRNQWSSHIVLRVSPQLWTRLTQAKLVHIDIQRVRVEDQSPLVQCSRCLGYGHGKRHCQETQDACSHCGGQHMGSDCTARLAGVEPECCNCKKANIDTRGHNTFSPECPIRRKWDALARATTAYC